MKNRGKTAWREFGTLDASLPESPEGTLQENAIRALE
jgi:hypothetical protein